MPVYEFYCSDCHTIFNFLAKSINTDKQPDCPKCARPALEKQVSRFAISRNRQEESVSGMPDIDEAKMEKVLMGMAGEMEGVDENDPRQMAKFMKKFSEATGMNLGSEFNEAMRRLESGEDPDKIEEDMGELFNENNMENLFSKDGIKGLKKRYTQPAHDETLYTL